MKLNEYRDEMMSLLVKVDTRQEEVYHRIGRIEIEHEKKITSLWSYGVAFIFIASVGINLIMRGF